MKKLILITLLFAALTINAQVRTVIRSVDADATYYIYNGTSDDVLDGDELDTLQLQLFLQKDYPVQYYAKSAFSPVTTADTTLKVKVYGKAFYDENWTVIDSTTFSGSASGYVIRSSQGLSNYNVSFTVPKDTLVFAFDTTDVATDSLNYYKASVIAKQKTITGTFTQTSYIKFCRYLMFEFIIYGNDSTGTGLKLDDFELKIWQTQ